MKSVKVNRLEVLEIVKANRVAHVADYEEAVDNYFLTVIEQAKKNIKIAKAGNLERVNEIEWNLPSPKSYEKEYDRAIRMIKLSVEDVIEIPSETFNQLVLDEWSWKHSFATVSAMYKSK